MLVTLNRPKDPPFSILLCGRNRWYCLHMYKKKRWIHNIQTNQVRSLPHICNCYFPGKNLIYTTYSTNTMKCLCVIIHFWPYYMSNTGKESDAPSRKKQQASESINRHIIALRLTFKYRNKRCTKERMYSLFKSRNMTTCFSNEPEFIAKHRRVFLNTEVYLEGRQRKYVFYV